MDFKSLLTTVVVAGASASAFAFPTITVNPEPDKTYDNVAYLANVQLNCNEPFSIVSDAASKPYFDNWDTGDQIDCITFEDLDFYGSVLHKIDFNESDFSDNGEWVLTIPKGCLKDGAGNLNEDILEFHYTLNDPNIGLGNFPKIELISSNPANGALLPYWGESLGKITFKTSDDAAVNYIDWFLYDITEGTDEASREYLRQGEENRIDVNRTFGDDSDQWANGLFITIGGANEKLIEGHTYRLLLRFCGIGYDPVTNQYPSPQQKAASLELETYIDFKGQSKGTEYSPYKVDMVSPNPEDYEIDNIDLGMFTVYYTGPVKPTTFVYSEGQGMGTAGAGTYSPASEADANGYADAWDFKFDESLLKGSTGTISVTIEAVDADGLPVKGNGGFSTDDFEYHMDWQCNLGADVLVSVEPKTGDTVEMLSTITVSNEAKKEMNLAWLTADRPSIVSQGRAVAIDLEEPEFSEDGTKATWTFDPITISGTYSLIIPKSYFIIGSEMNTTYNNQTTFIYVVEGDEPPAGDVKEELEPAETSLENNANLTEPLKEIVLSFANVTLSDFDMMTWDPIAPGQLYRAIEAPAREAEYELIEEVNPKADDDWSPKVYTYTFSEPVSANGSYKFVIAAGLFWDNAYAESNGESGNINPELVYNFTIGGGTGVEAILAETGNVDVYDIAGRVIVRNADAAQLKDLASGMYIINGKKYVVK